MMVVKAAHMRLCDSRMLFVRPYPRETQEMVFDAHDRAFAFFTKRDFQRSALPFFPTRKISREKHTIMAQTQAQGRYGEAEPLYKRAHSTHWRLPFWFLIKRNGGVACPPIVAQLMLS
jgi:hypothetical protein